MAKKYWLFKSEPSSYSIDDLKKDKTTYWDGVRNYQARNILRDEVQVGDEVLFYHSQANPPAVVGTAKVVKAGYPDHTQFDSGNKHFDPKAKEDNPRWFMVDIKYVGKFEVSISIDDIKERKTLGEMVLVNNSRLSVQPVRKKEWDIIVGMSSKK